MVSKVGVGVVFTRGRREGRGRLLVLSEWIVAWIVLPGVAGLVGHGGESEWSAKRMSVRGCMKGRAPARGRRRSKAESA